MRSLFRHARFQTPLTLMRGAVGAVWRAGFAAAGRYQPLAAEEQRWETADAVQFKGDIPLRAGSEHCQRRLVFTEPRSVVETVDDLIFTPSGAGWAEGRLHERYSACKPGLRMLVGPPTPKREIAEAYVVQAEHFETFGDWVSEYLAPLARVGEIHAPVLLPQALASTDYAKRYGAVTNIAFESVGAPVLVRKAHVVRQQRVIRYWRQEDAAALGRLLNASPIAPRPGSILYLSRHGEKSEIAERSYPSEAVEAIVAARGGRVIRTATAVLEDYIAAAGDAETIVYDHGSAAYNMIWWRPRRAIELVSDSWWVNAFVFFADALGVRDYTIIRIDSPGFSERLEDALSQPAAQIGGA